MSADSNTKALVHSLWRVEGVVSYPISLCVLSPKLQQSPGRVSRAQHGIQGPCGELHGPESARGICVSMNTHRRGTDALVCSTIPSISSKAKATGEWRQRRKGNKREKRKNAERDWVTSSKPCWESSGLWDIKLRYTTGPGGRGGGCLLSPVPYSPGHWKPHHHFLSDPWILIVSKTPEWASHQSHREAATV